jgi:hypothetical protein
MAKLFRIKPADRFDSSDFYKNSTEDNSFTLVNNEFFEFPISVQTGLGDVLITGYSPSINVTNNVTLISDVGTLSLNGYSPTVQAAISSDSQTGQITILGYEPNIIIPVLVYTDLGTLLIVGHAPEIGLTQNINADFGTVTIDGFSPNVNIAQNINTNTGQINIIGHAAVLENKINTFTGVLIITGIVPRVRYKDAVPVELNVGVNKRMRKTVLVSTETQNNSVVKKRAASVIGIEENIETNINTKTNIRK